MQDPIPEYYFSEKGEDRFSSGKAVHIQEYIFTDMGTPTLPGRTDKSFDCLLACTFSGYYKVYT